MSPTLPGRAALVYAMLGLLLIGSLVFATVNFLQRRQAPAPPINVPASAQACRGELSHDVDAQKLTPAVWDQIANVCYMRIRGEALLSDFNLRRSNLIEQQVEGRIVLWMVVAITLSGVALAGLQLLAAYKLASGGHGDLATAAGQGQFTAVQEITLEQNKISLKSSVTGLLILIVSFAFFMVYVAWVYTSKELRQETPEATNTAVTTPASPTAGEWGPPPAAPVPKPLPVPDAIAPPQP